MTAKKLRDRDTTWLLVVPVSNVVLTSAVNFELRLEHVTLIDATRLPYRRRRFGFLQRISALRRGTQGFLDRFFSDEKTFALVRRTGPLDDLEIRTLGLVRDELALLALSQLGGSKRWDFAPVSLAGERPHAARSYLFLDTKNGGWTQPNKRIGGGRPLKLDDDWKRFAKDLFFDKYLRVLRGDYRIGKGWRRDLRNAGVLAGQSQDTIDLPQAFLRNMVAIELLLTTQTDKHVDALPQRAEAFLGWTGFWDSEGYEAKIRAVYEKRCRLVHQGDRQCVAVEDLYFTDDLLLNLLMNIVGHIDLFHSKQAVVNFAKKVEASHILGTSTDVRPRTFRSVRRSYSDRDFAIE